MRGNARPARFFFTVSSHNFVIFSFIFANSLQLERTQYKCVELMIQLEQYCEVAHLSRWGSGSRHCSSRNMSCALVSSISIVNRSRLTKYMTVAAQSASNCNTKST